MNRIVLLSYMVLVFFTSTSCEAFDKRYEVLTPQTLAEFTFENPEGFPVGLDQFKGKVVVLNFWSVTCGPCIAEMPSLDQLSGYYKDDLVVIPVNVDDLKKAGLQYFYDENKYRYLNIYRDPKRKSQKALDWKALPTTLIINKDGQLVGRQVGYAKWDSPEALDMFDQLIQGKITNKKSTFFNKIKSWFSLDTK